MKKKLVLSVLSLFFTFTLIFPGKSQATTQESDSAISNISDRAIDTQEIKQNINTLSPPKEEQIIFQKIISNLSPNNISSKSMGNIMQIVAESFLGASYKAGLLDRTHQERLIISLQEFDCLLFVETVLALSRNIALQKYDYQSFAQNIVNQRYQYGSLNGYCSRLHYFSAWIYDNQNRNNVKDISTIIGGIKRQKKLNFMSQNRYRYPLLRQDRRNYQCIVAMEKSITNQGIPTNYIPKQKIKNIYNQLQSGDIIGITTNIAGLDVTHTGLVYAANGSIGLIHASPIGKVTIARDLHRYVNRVANSTGIVVARPIDPRIKK